MAALTFLALTLTLLPNPSLAQDSPQCGPLAPSLAYNASSTLPIPALSVAWLGDTADNDIRINNDTRTEWRLSAYVQPALTPAGPSSRFSTRTALWLDTGDSDLERLGSTMRMCHNYVPLQVREKVSWSGEALRKSVDDTGDCRSLVSEACLTRLRVQYGMQAQGQRGSGYDGCAETNNTVPWECEESGMVSPVTIPNPTFNGTLRSRLPALATSDAPLNTTDSLVCGGRNFSRSTATLASTQDYELGVTFPLMDIMTFFGTAGTGRIFRTDAFRVHIACLVPGSVAEGSQEKGSVGDVLEMYNITGGGDEESGAQALGRGWAMWAVGAWAVVVGAALVV